jgi:phospholipid-binding lipoprotein MlaA
LKTRGWYLGVGLLSFLIFTFLSSPILTGESGFNLALAAAEQAAGSESASTLQRMNDPHEQFNRKVFEFNDELYFYVMKPAATLYAAYFPPFFREEVRNGFHNLVFPSRFINFLLQGKGDKAMNELVRFIINSTLGLGGLFDIAQSHFKLENHESDFGQTLAIWGVRSGVFLMIPVLGPSNPRDFFGFAVDSVMDPLFWFPVEWWVSFSAQTGKYVNRTSLHIGEYEDLKKASLDPYIAMRDAYIQYREHIVSPQ